MRGNGGLIGAVLGLLGFLMMLAAMATQSTDAGDRPSVYNRGLLGHSDWLEILHRTGRRVSVSRQRDAGRRSGARRIHVVAEPDIEHLPETFPDAPRTLLVMPKWRLVRDPAGMQGKVTAPVGDHVHEWLRDRLDLPHALHPPEPESSPWTERALRLHVAGGPSFDGAVIAPVSVRAATGLDRDDGRVDLLQAQDGRVFAFSILHGDREVVVITDPDLVANHGLRRADNGRAMLALMDAIAASAGGDAGDPIEFVFDESVHGFVGPPGILAALVEPPLCWFAAYLLLAGAVVAWVLGRGFGPIRPPPEVLRGDGASLVHSAATLLQSGRRPDASLARYRRARERAVARAFHVRATDPDTVREELRRIGRARRHPFPDPSPKTGLDDARAIDRWCHEILDGNPSNR